MKKKSIFIMLLAFTLFLTSCVTSKDVTKLVDERLNELYPDVDI